MSGEAPASGQGPTAPARARQPRRTRPAVGTVVILLSVAFILAVVIAVSQVPPSGAGSVEDLASEVAAALDAADPDALGELVEMDDPEGGDADALVASLERSLPGPGRHEVGLDADDLPEHLCVSRAGVDAVVAMRVTRSDDRWFAEPWASSTACRS